MITPPFSGGMSFSEAADGDLRNDADARRLTSIGFKIADQWATVRQIHGATVHRVQGPGLAGEVRLEGRDGLHADIREG